MRASRFAAGPLAGEIAALPAPIGQRVHRRPLKPAPMSWRRFQLSQQSELERSIYRHPEILKCVAAKFRIYGCDHHLLRQLLPDRNCYGDRYDQSFSRSRCFNPIFFYSA